MKMKKEVYDESELYVKELGWALIFNLFLMAFTGLLYFSSNNLWVILVLLFTTYPRKGAV